MADLGIACRLDLRGYRTGLFDSDSKPLTVSRQKNIICGKQLPQIFFGKESPDQALKLPKYKHFKDKNNRKDLSNYFDKEKDPD